MVSRTSLREENFSLSDCRSKLNFVTPNSCASLLIRVVLPERLGPQTNNILFSLLLRYLSMVSSIVRLSISIYNHFSTNLEFVPGRGLEPPRITPHGPKPCAATNFATPACVSRWRLVFLRVPVKGIYGATNFATPARTPIFYIAWVI